MAALSINVRRRDSGCRAFCVSGSLSLGERARVGASGSLALRELARVRASGSLALRELARLRALCGNDLCHFATHMPVASRPMSPAPNPHPRYGCHRTLRIRDKTLEISGSHAPRS